MSFTAALRLLRRQWLLLLLVPVLLGASTYYFGRHQPVAYVTEATVYTGITSGYSLQGNADADYFAANNAADNLLALLTSRETKEEAILRLLAAHLALPAPDPAVLGEAGWRRLRQLVPPALRQQVVGPTPDSTLRRLTAYARANDNNFVTKLFDSGDPTYSLSALSHFTGARVGVSDLLKTSYEANDPAVARQTLALLLQVFIERYQRLHTGQAASVIQYYEAATRRAKQRLDAAEQRMLAFSRANRLVNFEEQTKDIATAKEALDAERNQAEMQYAGAVSALRAIDRRLAGRGTALRNSSQLLEQRQQLARLRADIADQELFARQNETSTAAARLAQLRTEAAVAEAAIRSSVAAYYDQSTSTAGIPTKPLLDDWVTTTVLVEEKKARLGVMNRRRADFEQEYNRLVPLGATLKSIEREIALAEKDYLALLAKLDDSQASRQNNELTSNLKVVDPPFLPGPPHGGKRLLLVLLAALGGLGATVAGVLGVGLLDRSLRAPGPAALRTGVPVGGVWPAGPPAYQQRAAEHLARHVLLQTTGIAHPAPVVVGVLSTHKEQGKTAVLAALAEHCATLGLPTLALYPHAAPTDLTRPTNRPAHAATATHATYPAELATVQAWPLARLLPADTAPHLVLLELPALLDDLYPAGLLAGFDLVLLAATAQSKWEAADQQALADLRTATPAPIELVLTAVPPEECTELLGPVPAGKRA